MAISLEDRRPHIRVGAAYPAEIPETAAGMPQMLELETTSKVAEKTRFRILVPLSNPDTVLPLAPPAATLV